MEQQMQHVWRLHQLSCGHDKHEPDSHLDPPSGLYEWSEKKNPLWEDENLVYLSLQSTKWILGLKCIGSHYLKVNLSWNKLSLPSAK